MEQPAAKRQKTDAPGGKKKDIHVSKLGTEQVKAHDLFIKGSKAESARCKKALAALAPGVDQGFIHGTICGMDAPGYRGDYPETWSDFLDFDRRWRLDWVRLYADHQLTGEYAYRVEDESERSIWFQRGRKEALDAWQRA
jgi:hypothetical protein